MEGYELNATTGITKLRSYKIICAKLGLIMSIYFLCRILNGITVSLISGMASNLSASTSYVIHAVIAVLLNYLVPIYITALVFKSFDNYNGRYRELYQKPKRLARALGSFPAMYGLGYGIALLTLLLTMLLSRFSLGQSIIEDLFRPATLEPSTDIISTLAMMFILVVVAPIFEEFLVRGIIYDALEPYGSGIAIIISSILFGLMHGNMNMLFYTTALGFALGYIRYATRSIFATTVLHAIINSVAAGMLFVLSLSEITYYENKLVNTLFSVYILAMLMLIAIGIIAFIKKIPAIRKYKIENIWTEIGAGRKAAIFFLSIPVLIMLVLAFNEHSNYWLLNLIIN